MDTLCKARKEGIRGSQPQGSIHHLSQALNHTFAPVSYGINSRSVESRLSRGQSKSEFGH